MKIKIACFKHRTETTKCLFLFHYFFFIKGSGRQHPDLFPTSAMLKSSDVYLTARLMYKHFDS